MLKDNKYYDSIAIDEILNKIYIKLKEWNLKPILDNNEITIKRFTLDNNLELKISYDYEKSNKILINYKNKKTYMTNPIVKGISKSQWLFELDIRISDFS